MQYTRAFSFTAIIIFICSAANAQGFKQRFDEAFSKKDTVEQGRVLQQWEKAAPKDAELFISWYNHYVRRAREQMITIDINPKDSTSLRVKDSAGKEAFLNSTITYNKAVVKRGFEYIDKGIALYPDRLDMRFGKAYMLSELKDYTALTEELVKAVNHGYKIKMKWKWSDGKPLPKPETFFFDNLQSYISTLYNTGDDNLLPAIRTISEAVLKHNPNHAVSLSNMALTYIVQRENDKALEYLLKAEKLTPKDVVVINNIAEIYGRIGNYPLAREYYTKMILHGNEQDKAYAHDKMERMK